MIVLLAICMEVSWLSAWATLGTAAMLGHPFALVEAAIALAGAVLVTRLSSGRGWLVLGVLTLQAAGLLGATALVLHALYSPAEPLMATAWLRDLVRADQPPQQWAILVVNGAWALAFWLSGVLLARRGQTYERLCARFDVGLAAFFALFLVRLAVAANGGAVDDPISHLFMFPFVVASLVAIGLVRTAGDSPTAFLSGHRGAGIFLTFAATALLSAATLTLVALPYLRAASQVGLTGLKAAGRVVSPLLIWILRLLFAPQTLRTDAGGARSGRYAGCQRRDGAGWWVVGRDAREASGWGLVGAVALAGAAAVGVALFYRCRYLLSRTRRSRPGPRRRRWLFRLRPRPSRRAAALTATDFYVRLLGWARRSGLPRATAETASELAARLQGRFPPLAATIAAIVKAYNEEAYREVGPGPAGLGSSAPPGGSSGASRIGRRGSTPGGPRRRNPVRRLRPSQRTVRARTRPSPAVSCSAAAAQRRVRFPRVGPIRPAEPNRLPGDVPA